MRSFPRPANVACPDVGAPLVSSPATGASLPIRFARTALFAFRSGTARIHQPLFWHLFYGLLERRAAIASSAALVRAVGRRVDARPEDLLEKASHLFLTGWPHHLGTPWVNLNV